MNPHIINCLLKGYEEKVRQEDYLQHIWWGTYGISAMNVAIEHCFSKKAKSKFIEKPIFADEKKAKSGYKESQEEVAVFEMKQRTKMLEKSGLRQSPI